MGAAPGTIAPARSVATEVSFSSQVPSVALGSRHLSFGKKKIHIPNGRGVTALASGSVAGLSACEHERASGAPATGGDNTHSSAESPGPGSPVIPGIHRRHATVTEIIVR